MFGLKIISILPIFFIAFFIASYTSYAQNQAKKSTTNSAASLPQEKTMVIPDITYRQAFLTKRRSSVFLDSAYKDYGDQLYMSLKLLKTYDFVNEIVLEPVVRTKRKLPGQVETTIDQGYVRIFKKKWSLTAGKKNESTGSGFLLSPSDLLNEDRDIYDPLYQREGKAFTQIGWIDGLNEVYLGVIPKQQQDRKFARSWFKAKTNLAQTELGIHHTYNATDLSTVGVWGSRFFGDKFELHADARLQQRARGQEAEPERVVFDCESISAIPEQTRTDALRPIECLEVQPTRDKWTSYAVLGSRYVMTARRTFILEAIQNQRGLSNEEQKNYYNYIFYRTTNLKESIEPPTRPISKSYGFFAYQDEDSIKDTLVGFSVLYNTNDQSSQASAEVKHQFNPFMNVSVAYSVLSGAPGTEFGEFPYKDATYLIVRGRF